ncbi:hypothetical protein ACROYT_G038811 [Oculina patagonica]
MSDSASVAITTVLSILAIIDVVGNSLVCVIIKRNRELRIPINYLLVNLAVVDILYATFIAVKIFFKLTFTHQDGVIGKVLCKFITDGNVAWIGGASSIVTLVAIAIERYYAVMYPHGNKGKLTKRKLKGVTRVRKRVTLMVVTVTAIFGICWGTGLVVYILKYITPHSIGPVPIVISNTVILFNSAVNPFVYALLSQQFRVKIKRLISLTGSLPTRVHSIPEPQFIDHANKNTQPTDTAGPSSME